MAYDIEPIGFFDQSLSVETNPTSTTRLVSQKSGEDIKAITIQKIKEYVHSGGAVEFLIYSGSTAPTTYSTGDKYYNTSTGFIYVANSSDVWVSEGAPLTKIAYVVVSQQKIMVFNGNAMVDIPVVNNNTITIRQGGVTKGSFTLNQSSNSTIDIDAGGGGGGGSVNSVNGKTGTVVLTQDDIADGTTYVQTENNYSDNEKENVASNTTARHTHTNLSLLETYTQTEVNISDAVSKKHSHENISVLGNITAAYTTAEQTKLAGIAAGAEVNVQSDWNQSDNTKDDYIKNKPSNLIENNTQDDTSVVILGGSSNDSSENVIIGYGAGNVTDSNSCVVIGSGAGVNGYDNISVGYGANVEGHDSIALGYNAGVSADGAIQIGNGENTEDNTLKVSLNSTNYKILSSDGTIPSERLANALPPQAGHAGKVLKTNGTTAEWSPAGSGGDVNVIEIVKVNGSALTPDANKAVNVVVPTKTSDITNDSSFVDTIALNTALSTKQNVIDSEHKLSYSLISETPVIPTKTSDLTNDSGFVDSTYHDSTKVDVVSGKGLSSNDYTTSEKTKLAGIADGAEVNVKSDWNAVSGAAQILNKPNLATVATSGSYNDLSDTPTIPTVPVNISDLTDDTSTNPIDKADTLTGLTASVSELNFTDGVTSNIQTQLDSKGTYSKPSDGIPSSDMDSTVRASLGKADTALQSHQDISGKENTSNKVASVSSASTDTQYPSAKCVYDGLATKSSVSVPASGTSTTDINYIEIDGTEYRIPSGGGGGGLTNHNFTFATLANNTTAITFAANQRCYQRETMTAGATLTFAINNASDNYLRIYNSSASAITLAIGSITYNGTAISTIIVPNDTISVAASAYVEIGIVCDANEADITVSQKLKLNS